MLRHLGEHEPNAAKVVTADLRSRDVPRSLIRAFDECDSPRLQSHFITALGYIAGDDACHRLISVITGAVENDSFGMNRGNALAALGRIGTERSIGFVLSVLGGKSQEVNLTPAEIWPVCRAAYDFRDDRIAREILRTTPAATGKATQTVDACLRLCGKGFQPEAKLFCLRVINSSKNPRLVGKAFLLLPLETRIRRYELILDLLRNQRDPSNWKFLIPALAGLQIDEVGEYLAELVDRAVLRIPPAVFEVLAEDYGELMAGRALEWGRRGRPYALRIAVARQLARRGTAADLDLLREMLAPKERPRLKLEALELLCRGAPEFFADTMSDIWQHEQTAFVAKRAMKLL